LLRSPQDAQAPGRYRALNEIFEPELTTMIIQPFKEGKAMIKMEFLGLARERYSAGLIKGWLNAFVGRHFDALQTFLSLPQGDRYQTAPREDLDAYIEYMKALVVESSPSSSSI
jgi:hypothetical protein